MQKPQKIKHSQRLYVGTHRRAHHADPGDIAFGIYAFGSTPSDHLLAPLGMTATPQPGWLAAHPNGRFLYAVNEVGRKPGEQASVSAFAIDANGGLQPLNSRPTPPMPCHCEVDATGRYLVVATFGGGTVHLFPLSADGYIEAEADVHKHAGSSVHPRQTSPHAHAASFDPANRFVFAPDLGIDQVLVYELDSTAGKLLPRPARNVRIAPGSGPRHIVFDAQARFAYLINEISATITVFSYDASQGALTEIQSIDLLPEGFAGLRSGAQLAIHPTAPFLYATTRSHGSSGEPPVRGLDTLVWFAIGADGRLRLAGRVATGGEIPRSFTFDDSGEHLLIGHQCSGTIVTFRIDPHTGTPTAIGTMATPVPVCLRFVPE